MLELSENVKMDKRCSRDLVSDDQLEKLLSYLKKESLWPEQVWTILVTITGRRFKDIGRLRWKNVTLTKDGVFCLVNKDKCSKFKNVNFGFEWSDWDLNFDLVEFKSWLISNKLNGAKGFVVKNGNNEKLANNMKQNIKRKGGFRLHSIRNRRAIVLLINGKSEEATRAKIGWKNLNTLYRYTIINSDEIKKCKSYEKCRNLILNRDE